MRVPRTYTVAGPTPAGATTRVDLIPYTPRMIRSVLSLALAYLLLGAAAPQLPATYEAYAVRFGILPAFPVAGLVAGAERGRTLDIPVMVWLLRGSNGRQVLVDSGFHHQKFLDQWKPRDFRTPAAAVQAAGVTPDAVTDIIISHAHWDHVDGIDLFPKATIWIQREEYRYYTGEAWQSRGAHGGVDADDMQALLKVNTEGRLRFVEGDDQEIIPGLRCYTGGKHTWASQYVAAATRGGTVVLTSDNVYLYENLDKHAAIAQTLDAASNLKAQDRIRTLASDPRLIVPGHDPLVFERFATFAEGIVRIK
jgi:glyoxylase-like metal-dependent hydrolase (beta-lactamase superfamily II)